MNGEFTAIIAEALKVVTGLLALMCPARTGSVIRSRTQSRVCARRYASYSRVAGRVIIDVHTNVARDGVCGPEALPWLVRQVKRTGNRLTDISYRSYEPVRRRSSLLNSCLPKVSKPLPNPRLEIAEWNSMNCSNGLVQAALMNPKPCEPLSRPTWKAIVIFTTSDFVWWRVLQTSQRWSSRSWLRN